MPTATPDAPATTSEVLTIGGRAFVAIAESHLDHDIYLQRELRKAGLLVQQGGAAAALDPDASEDDAALAFLCAVHESGRTFTVLAGLLVDAAPDGTPLEWTSEMAAANAAFFAHVRDRESKQLLQGVLSVGVAPFFAGALASLRNSRSSSSQPGREAGAADPVRAAAGTSATATGTTSSSASSSTTPSAPATADAGPSATP